MPRGIDITAVDRLRAVVERRPAALRRLFSEAELRGAGHTRQRWPRLAARFAAKEALIKAAGGLHGSSYRDIQVLREANAPPRVMVQGPLGDWIREKGYRVEATLSHEDAFAVALVVLAPREEGSHAGDMDT